MRIFLIILFCLVAANVSAQRTLPKSFEYKNLESIYDLPMLRMSKVNHRILTEEDLSQPKENANRFAVSLSADIDILKHGKWENAGRNGRICRLKIYSEGAKNLHFLFDKFSLAEGAQLFIYNEDKSQILGAFKHTDNRPDQTFAIYLLEGSVAIFEYYEPINTSKKSQLHINTVYHGYKGLMDFGNSGACNNNVNCPLGDNWKDEKRAIALILAGGANGIRWCTGALVNNAAQDATPYFLTANHCLTGAENNWAFVFNYESPDCSNIDGSLNQYVLGSQVVATDLPSDFALLLLDNPPSIDYLTYHLGWDATNTLKDSVVAIHHPAGDIKKISIDYDSIVSNGYFTVDSTHWEVLDWDSGTTEGGSSGSPLMDKFGRLIGQLHGGWAACGNDLSDYYGKFSHSWNTGNAPDKRLKDWLDPNNTGTLVIDGGDFNSPQYELDVSSTKVTGLSVSYCDTNISGIKYVFRNLGEDTITSAIIKILIDNQLTDSILWTGIMPFAQTTEVDLNPFSVTSGDHILTLIISLPNNSTDENSANDTIRLAFSATNGNLLDMTIKTDFWGNENGIELYDSNNKPLFTRQGLPDNTVYNQSVCLTKDDCYKFFITDSEGDGISSGYYKLFIDEVEFDGGTGNFGSEARIDFCICKGEAMSVEDYNICTDTTQSINEKLKTISIYPNPFTNEFKVQGLNPLEKENEFKIYDLLGRIMNVKHQILKDEIIIDGSNLEMGIYLLNINHNEQIYRYKIIKK